ncbi:MAG TPA: SPFH/Band 7/PHB domain protein, partial [Actinoplanes sp.]|nr:SPFH/Band 7/PHB domain protein [Actinoplanes sp.]
EAAQAAQAEAEAVNEQVRVAEAQVSSDSGPKGLPAPEPIPPSAALGGADYNGVAQQDRAQ